MPAGGAETVWNNGGGEGTGGGFSKVYAKPTWQPANTQGTGRMVPDWAAVADPNTGYDTIVDGQWQVIGGTSAVAPLMAGFLAVVNGARLKSGLPMLNWNVLSSIWSMAGGFYDILSGSNGSYNATIGPDPCTGMGRALPTLFAMLTGTTTVPPPVPTPPPTPTPTPPAPTKLFSLPFPVVRAGQKVTFRSPVNIPKCVMDFVPEATAAVVAGEEVNVED